MKNITAIIAALTLAIAAFGQDTLYIYQTDGEISKLSTTDIDSIIFYRPGTTITDADGNVYETIRIGSQTWMAENLRTTKFRNGDDIATTNPVRDIQEEIAPKYQWAYDGLTANAPVYGRLYTWYAITDERGVCPANWHVPTDSEWTTLIDVLGGADLAGGKLKAIGYLYWESPNTGANNNSSFNARAAGYSFSAGGFTELGNTANFWTATPELEDFAWYRSLSYNSAVVSKYNITRKYGYSVRCIKD